MCATSCRQSSYYCKYGKWNELRLCAPMFALHWCPTRSTRRHGGATLRLLANQVSAAATTHKAVWGQKHQLCVSGTKFGRPRTIPSVHCSPPSLSVTGYSYLLTPWSSHLLCSVCSVLYCWYTTWPQIKCCLITHICNTWGQYRHKDGLKTGCCHRERSATRGPSNDSLVMSLDIVLYRCIFKVSKPFTISVT